MSKKGLGRGLGALITERETESSEIKEIMLADIVPNPGQPRREFDREKLQELADSIQEHGLLQPILVKPEGSRYIIIAGERRFRATQLAGIDRINCIVRDCTEQEMTEKALIENIQRADLSPVEEGLAYARLIQDYGLTQEQVARRVGKGRPTVANLLRIIQLPAEVLELINKEAISLGHAKVILSLENKEQQISLAKRAVEGLLSVRETETIVQNSEKKEQPAKNAVKTLKNKSYSSLNDLEEKLRHSFQTKVAVSGSEEKGKIEINYYSRDELNRLLERWEIEV
ncbi:ParB/RepB/Spo0J family partition protein [Dehalobacter sp. TBBPA1]|uniref:ParB/RepB/Spo0J family partition protein n=1 Tax=Dehalobacter sp. TBBPA1 TaxID=3235037 RepID=UPI0034A4891A